MVQAIVVPVDPEEPARLEQLDGIDAYRSLVEGHVEFSELFRPLASMYFNEEGKLQELPLNPRATVLWWAHNRAFRGHDVIAGPAFIVGPVDAHGNDTDVPGALVKLLLHTVRYRVEVRTAGESSWTGNGPDFTDWFQAYAYGVDLAQRWTAVKDIRIVSADDTPSA